ncbi:hypothetical protein CASFOL_019210 [Castilleja foliolosa]|uniref:MORF/ORRM1/DAG-like MORF domain-containing protein n=1 Tax=Castilleja foliolosa TaxID=1961234 RepID=A0ABD3D7E4_9LAMI
MATRYLSRALLSTTKPLYPFLSHSYTTAASSASVIPKSFFRLRPIIAAVSTSYVRRFAPAISTRGFATRQTSSSLNDPNPNWSNRPPKETILLDGCDFEHWLVVMEKPDPEWTRDDIIDSYIKTLATVVGSEEEARMKIYTVSTKHYYAFGALVSEELSYKIKELPRVTWVLPDSYLDVRNKDYGGEPFINGQAVPYDSKYHEEWVRNNARANDRNRRNDRPRNNDRSRNFERRNQNSGGGGNFGGGPPGGNPPNYAAQLPPPPNAPNAGGMQQQNFANNGPGNYQQPRGPPSPLANNNGPNNSPGNYQQPRGPPQPMANNNGPNHQYGPSNGTAPYHPGPGPNQGGYAPAMGGPPNQNNVSNDNAYAPPSTGGVNHYQNQNRGYGPNGQNPGGYTPPAPNAGYGPGPNQNSYVQGQNVYPPQNGGPGQNQGGGYVNQNVAGRDPNY